MRTVTLLVRMHGQNELTPLPTIPTHTIVGGAKVGLCRHIEDFGNIGALRKRYREHKMSVANEMYEMPTTEWIERDKHLLNPDDLDLYREPTEHLRKYLTDRTYTIQEEEAAFVMGILVIHTNVPELKILEQPTEMVPLSQEVFASDIRFVNAFQSVNLLNVAVASKLGGFDRPITAEYTGIPHYKSITLTDLLHYFGKWVDHVNVIDEACRIYRTPYKRGRRLSFKEKKGYKDFILTSNLGGTKKLNRRKKMGGMKLLAQGTHGSIYEMGDKVVKQFKHVSKHKPSLCKAIKDTIRSQCDEVDYEYQVQQRVYDLLKRMHLNIQVPECSHFIVQGDTCQYTMDRIYPLDKHLYYVDMTFPTGERPGQTPQSKQLGYVDVANHLHITPTELAIKIGELFSALHFLLNLDGYDCELILGKGGLYWIDFDKVSCFEWNTNQTLIRKVAEDVYDEKVITSYKKLARFLFASLISMSLLPIDMKGPFFMGYQKYSKIPEFMEEMAVLIDEYSI